MDHPRKKPRATNHHQFLTGDLVTEILLHLPVQTLLRFRTVCKSWRHIIDSSKFRDSHINNQLNNNNNNNDDTVFVEFNDDEKFKWQLSMIFPDNGKLYEDFPSFQEFFNNNIKSDSIRVSGPVNGLICIHSKHIQDMSLHIAICNPSLGKIKILRNWLPPSTVTCNIGFGFDYVAKDYKIVQLLHCNEQYIYRYRVRIYSVTTNSWRVLAAETLDQILFRIKPIKSTYKNGSFTCWRARRRNIGEDNIENVVVLFDVCNEVFETIPIPDFENMKVKSKVLAKEESFVLFVYRCYDCEGGDNLLKIWECKKSVENKWDWTHLSNIELFGGVQRPVALWKSDGVVLRYYFEKKKLNFYDYRNREIRGCFEVPGKGYRFKIFEYKGSFVLT